MKIGILTYHFAVNYGAALQTLALAEFLRGEGNEVSVVDYRPTALAGGYRWFDLRRFWGKTPGKFISKTRSELKVIGARRERYSAFRRFVSARLPLAPVSCLDGGYDLILVGSDQVWNTALAKGFDPLYWGEDARLPERIASYAASFGGAVPEGAAGRLAGRFAAVSVREKSSAEALSAAGLPARYDVDPVFLLPKSRWEEFASRSTMAVEEPYLLFYQVKPSQEALEYARRTASGKGLKLVCLSAKLEMENSPEVIACGPEDFLKLFSRASEVVTTSFHGTAFSLVFGKPFKVFKATGSEDTRIDDLLSQDGSLERAVETSRQYLKTLTER